MRRRGSATDSVANIAACPVKYKYDDNGNIVKTTDAEGIYVEGTYDGLNRLKVRNYSDSTPAVSFYYDGKGLGSTQSPNFAKGKLTKVTSSVSETQYQLFDNLGRMTQMAQITDGETYTSKYTYNFAGALIEEEYPSGRKVKNEFETDGDLLRVSSMKAGVDIFRQYVSNFAYTASGGISQMRLGNGRWETAKFNNRMQVTELGLGNSATDASVWKTNYDYGEIDSNGDVDTTKNTGNIARQTLTVPGTSFVQSYIYDSLYRLTEAKEMTGASQNWIQNWSYDRYGNRTGFTQNIAGLTAAPNPTIDANTNRFNGSQGFVYDKNGNITEDVDPATSQPRTFVFNGDNKQKEIRDANDVLIGQYFYDGEGKRVKKVVPATGETTVFVYSSGKLIAEYSTKLSQTPSVSFTTTDHLGSPRIITDALGQVSSRRDFLPFGEDIYQNVGARTSALNYGSSADEIRQKFTGYQKDTETGLDFAEARMYDNNFGRFTAVDPLLASGRSANPQSFNRYIYTSNNPIIRTDPTGLDWFKRYNEEEKHWEYNETGGVGWTAVEYNEDGYATVEGWCWGNDCGSDGQTTGYLYQSGGWDRGKRANYGITDAVADTGIGIAQWGWNNYAAINNGLQWAASRPSPFMYTGQSTPAPNQLSFWNASNQTQANAQSAMTAVSLYWGAASAGSTSTTAYAGFSTVTTARTGVGTSSTNGQVFQRVVSNAELEATKATNLLRGGRAGENFFTNAASLDAKRAQIRLGLDGPLRDQRITFRILDDTPILGPTRAKMGQSGTNGGGLEYFTATPTRIEILRTQPLRR